MTNHFRSALEKLTTEEASAVVAPLMAVLLANEETPDEATPAADFANRYAEAMAANGHELIWMAPNGRRFEDPDAVDAESDDMPEVVGFGDQRPRRRPELEQATQWRGLAASITGGRIGVPIPRDFNGSLPGTTLATVIG